ncbi:PAS domain S-box protein [Hahella ganghwensis]|uniref:PAS domain S-box protein n=1 Tax=Hahella ganghwensis TaxID=286420 RepID=UPI00036381A6|nr:PAS domain S-box protein [Hahella ganghwensis]
MTIQHKQITLFGLFGTLLFALLYGLSHKVSELVEGRVMLDIENRSGLIMSSVDRNLFVRYQDPQAFVLSLGELSGKSIIPPGQSAEKLEKVLNRFVQQYHVYKHILILDVEGRLIATSTQDSKGQRMRRPDILAEDVQSTRWFQEVLEERYFQLKEGVAGTVVYGPSRYSVPYQKASGAEFEMVFAAPIKNTSGEIIGVWANILDFSVIEDIFAENYRALSEEGFVSAELMLLDDKGRMIVDYDPVHRSVARYVRDFEILGKRNLVQQGVESARMAVAGLSGAGISTHYAKDYQQVAGYTHSQGVYDFPGMNWSTIVGIPLEEAYKESKQLFDLVFYISTFLILALLSLGMLLAFKTSYPLRKLTNIVRKMSTGDLSNPVPEVKTQDEVGEISRAIEVFRERLIEGISLQEKTEVQQRELEISRRAIEVTATGIVVCDARAEDTPIVFINRAFEKLTGYCEKEVIGRNCRFLQGKESDQAQLRVLREAIHKGASCNVVIRNYRKDGTPFWNNLRIDPVYNDAGELTHFIGAQTDVSEIKQLQSEARREMERRVAERTRALQATESRMRAIFDTAIDGTVVTDDDGIILDVNRSIELLFGCIREELIGNNLSILLTEPYRSEQASFLESFKSKGNRKIVGESISVMGCHKSGRVIPLELSIGETWVEGNRLFVAIMRDVTQALTSQENQERLSEELRESEQRYRAAFDLAPVGIARVSIDGHWLEINNKLCDMLGYDKEDLLNSSFESIVHPDDLPSDKEQLKKVLDGEIQSYTIDNRYFRKPGEAIWINLSVSLVKDRLGNPKYFIWILEDINERKKFEQQLEIARLEREELLSGFSLATEAGGICIWSWDLMENYIQWDQRMYQLYGLDPETSVNYKIWTDAIIDDEKEEAERQIQDLISNRESLATEYRISRYSDKQVRWVRAAAVVIKNDNGVPVKMFGINQDISSERLAQKALEKESRNARQASEAKSRFLATMSHEIRTPMNGVIGMIDLLRDTQLSADQTKMANTIRESAFSLLDIINDILDFSKIEAGQMSLAPVSTSLLDIVERSVEALWAQAASQNIDIFIDADLSIPPRLFLDPVRLRQILLNLLGNAIKFSRGTGRHGEVWVKLELLSKDTQRVEENEAEEIQITIEDNGIGMTDQQISNLFRPFSQADSSTTRNYGGTGLGLTITKSFIEMMGGRIAVQSEIRQGSQFVFVIPCCRSNDKVANINDLKLANLSILVVMEHEKFANTICSQVTQLGGRAIDTRNLEHAAEVIGDFADPKYKLDICILSPDISVSQFKEKVAAPAVSDMRYLMLTKNASAKTGQIQNDQIVVGAHPLKPTDLLTAIAILAGRESLFIEFHEFNEDDTSYQQEVVPTISEAERDGSLILVAEDQPINREVLEKQLGKLGYACVMVANGRQALNEWQQGRFALLLTDCHMPELDGFELTSKIRHQESLNSQLGRTPIVAITANALVGEADHCLAAGMDDYLSKPVDLKKLKLTLAKWIKRRSTAGYNEVKKKAGSETATSSGTQSIDGSEQPPEVKEHRANGDKTPIDWSVLSEVLGTEDRIIIANVLQFYWQTVSKEFGGIDRAIENTDSKALKNRVHAAKGAALSVGAPYLTQTLTELQEASASEDWEEINLVIEKVRNELGRVGDYLESEKIL